MYLHVSSTYLSLLRDNFLTQECSRLVNMEVPVIREENIDLSLYFSKSGVPTVEGSWVLIGS